MTGELKETLAGVVADHYIADDYYFQCVCGWVPGPLPHAKHIVDMYADHVADLLVDAMAAGRRS